MAKAPLAGEAFPPRIVTANDLLVGDVVYLTAAGGWSRRLAEAAVAETPEAAERLLALAAGQPDRAVGPYLAAVARDAGGALRFAHHREAIRDHGPTIRPDLDRNPAPAGT